MLLAYSAHDIDAAGLAVDAALPPPWLDQELADASLTAKTPGHVVGRLSRSGNDVVVRAKVRASLTTPCARCLEPASIEVDTELSLLLRPVAPSPPPKAAKTTKGASPAPKATKPEPKEVEYEFTSEEADMDTFDGETVVLDPFVREAILLEVPNFPLCSEGCPGIRPAAAVPVEEAAPPVDPRLAPLAALRARGLGGEGSPSAGKSKTKKNKE